MDWHDERYVRLYTRDTVNWKLMGWQARCLMPLLLRKADRAGCVDVGEDGTEGIAALVDIPVEVAEVGLRNLLARGAVVIKDGTLCFPKYMDAQEAKHSDRARQEESRGRKRDALLRNRDTQSQGVTGGHTGEQSVTSGHAVSLDVTPSLAVPCCTQPSQEEAKASVAHGLPPQAHPEKPPQVQTSLIQTVEPPKPRKTRTPKPEPDPQRKAASALVWQAYSDAFKQRHKTEPTRNARVNGQIAQFLHRVPMEDAPAIAAFFVSHSSAFYVGQLHPVGLLLKDAEKLRAEWMRGQAMTATQARREEASAENPWARRLREMDAEAARKPETVACVADEDEREEN